RQRKNSMGEAVEATTKKKPGRPVGSGRGGRGVLSGARGGGTHGLEKGRIPDTPSSTPILKKNTQTTLQLETDLKSVIGSSQKQTPDPRIRLSQFMDVESSSTSASRAASQEGGKQDVNMTPEDSDEEL
ncbi:MAG: hypothetical protein MMC33_010074, partial [Icmadophila ericetorum]|nr:hypothetical protein [Icmadophila ericetorum]